MYQCIGPLQWKNGLQYDKLQHAARMGLLFPLLTASRCPSHNFYLQIAKLIGITLVHSLSLYSNWKYSRQSGTFAFLPYFAVRCCPTSIDSRAHNIQNPTRRHLRRLISSQSPSNGVWATNASTASGALAI